MDLYYVFPIEGGKFLASSAMLQRQQRQPHAIPPSLRAWKPINLYDFHRKVAVGQELLPLQECTSSKHLKTYFCCAPKRSLSQETKPMSNTSCFLTVSLLIAAFEKILLALEPNNRSTTPKKTFPGSMKQHPGNPKKPGCFGPNSQLTHLRSKLEGSHILGHRLV